jgi:hypothetical protein
LCFFLFFSSEEDLLKIEQRDAQLFCAQRVAGRCSWDKPFELADLARILSPAMFVITIIHYSMIDYYHSLFNGYYQ